MLSLSVFPLSFRFLSSASVPLPATQLSVSSVPLFLALPLSGFSSASVLPFSSPVFHLLFRLVSHASFPVFGTWLSVRFLSSFPVSLPQPFHRCFPSFPLPLVRFSSGLFCLLSASFRPLQPAFDYSAFCSFFSLLPVLPWQRFLRCFFPLPAGLFPCLPSDSGTQLSAFPFSVRCLASQWLPQRLSLLPCGSRPFPLGFRFRFWLLGIANVFISKTFCPLRVCHSRSRLAYISTQFQECQALFLIFLNLFSKLFFGTFKTQRGSFFDKSSKNEPLSIWWRWGELNPRPKAL